MGNRSLDPARTASVGRRLHRAFGALMGLLVATAVIAVIALEVSTSSLDHVVERDDPAIEANAGVLQAMTDAETGVRGYLVTGNPAFLEPYQLGTAGLPAALAETRRLAEGNQAIRASVDAQARLAQVWFDEFAEPVIVLRRDDPAAADALAIAGVGRTRFNAFREVHAATASLLENRREADRERAETIARTSALTLAALVVGGLALGLAVSVRTASSITRPLRRVTDTLARLTSGDGDVRAVEEGPSEVRAVALSVNALAAANAGLQEGLRASAQHLTAVLRAATEHAIIACDTVGTITLFNEGAERMLGYQAEDLVGSANPAIFHDEAEVAALAVELGVEPGLEVFVAAARHDVTESREWTYLRRDGSRLPVMLTVSALHDANGGLCGFMGIATDTSEVKQAQEAQRQAFEREHQAAQQLRELDRAKSELVASVSHELRTPLTSITGYLEMLLDEDAGPVNDEQRQMLDVVDRNARRLLALIQDILTLSRIESGAFQLKMVPTEITSLVESVRAAMLPVAARQSLTLRIDVDSDVGIVEGDADQLERVLLNLLSNAIKFTPPGGTVDVEAHRRGREVHLVVRDSGMGIPAAEQEKLFSPFFRSSTAHAQAIQGTGLGLAIVRTIVERHGGEIALTSQEGVGTTVQVVLPAAQLSVAGRSA